MRPMFTPVAGPLRIRPWVGAIGSDSPSVNVDHRQLVERRLEGVAVVMHLEEFGPVGQRAS
ncbi:MAG: hypothetical protein ACKOEM_00330 [Planctomycetia bacterium]